MKKEFKIQLIAKKQNTEIEKTLNLNENFFNTLKDDFLQSNFESIECRIVQNSTRQHIEKVVMLYELLLETLDYINEDLKTDIMLLISEALSNAVYHGNLKMPKDFRKEKSILEYEMHVAKTNPQLFDKKVEIESIISPEKFLFKITDSGEGFDYKTILSKTSPPHPMEEFGRGIFIIKNSADEISFNNNGKTLKIIKYIGG
ncbi:serine/threonine-protein kinase RsbW [Thermotomaculum hydrothermale]|uniref:Serine/threonine-protein kinase RsbW n=1 Tax=Thermotomaculum hydrothermale TaxID=981385 RepID=A0A7R6PM92_9BACT|nr:ATP-binding protein [Thermotomaculum hydrothermale]BBB31731.1 serine/threonine-protein kinase RsbW [Thermotomaculum hydrothermale]